jgi:hypothetical protein
VKIYLARIGQLTGGNCKSLRTRTRRQKEITNASLGE